MQTFISETIATIAKKHKSFQDVILVLPSQRAKVFVKQALKNEISIGFLPELLNIEEFVSEVSGIAKADAIELLFHFYKIYSSLEKNPDSFDVFSSWAQTVIQDFNEIDQHLVDTNDIFVYIRDIQRLRKWSVKGEFQETELMKDHYSFLERLNEYYTHFYTFLTENHIGYSGISYREATKKITKYVAKNSFKSFYFIGFNSLNGAEEIIVQEMLHQGNTEIYWDIDTSFLQGNHQAGTFIRRYLQNWKYYQRNEIQTTDWFSKQKNIQIIGASKNITQIKYAGELLSKFDNYTNTALVLADEGLLPIALNSLPDTIEKVNITMGYPLKDIPASHLISSIFRLFVTQEKLGKTTINEFYHKDIVSFLKQSFIQKLFSKTTVQLTDTIINEISKRNLMFVSKDFLLDIIPEQFTTVRALFNPFTTTIEFISRIRDFIFVLKDNVSVIEKEYLFRFHSIFTQLYNLQEEFGFFTELKTLQQFFVQLLSSESLSFQGEPLEGLQIMGMLETRVLDFKNIILTSVNEGVLPANSMTSSFIPFDVKLAFGLPTYREKDSIFSYHFFRLLQRAENIYLIYNTETDAFGKGEKSRFVSQLQLSREGILEKVVSPKVVTEKIVERVVEKNEHVLIRLKELAGKGISPSAIATYLYNPMKFYQQKVLGFTEINDVEETAQMNTLGNVVHDTLEEFYKPFIGKFIAMDNIMDMESRVRETITKYFTKHFVGGDITTGKNRLIFEVAIRFIENFLKQEKELVNDKKNQLKIIATEQQLEASIQLPQLDFPIKIHGKVDRIDELNGVVRIIDYKTGKVTQSDMKIPFFEDLNDYKHHKSIQVLLYAFMFLSDKRYENSLPLEAGIISFKNLKSGFMPLNFAEKRGKDFAVTREKINQFIDAFSEIVTEIYAEEIPFSEPLELAF